jgi:hypothetical protein
MHCLDSEATLPAKLKEHGLLALWWAAPDGVSWDGVPAKRLLKSSSGSLPQAFPSFGCRTKRLLFSTTFMISWGYPTILEFQWDFLLTKSDLWSQALSCPVILFVGLGTQRQFPLVPTLVQSGTRLKPDALWTQETKGGEGDFKALQWYTCYVSDTDLMKWKSWYAIWTVLGFQRLKWGPPDSFGYGLLKEITLNCLFMGQKLESITPVVVLGSREATSGGHAKWVQREGSQRTSLLRRQLAHRLVPGSPDCSADQWFCSSRVKAGGWIAQLAGITSTPGTFASGCNFYSLTSFRF